MARADQVVDGDLQFRHQFFFLRSRVVVHGRSSAKQGSAVVAERGMHDQLR